MNPKALIDVTIDGDLLTYGADVEHPLQLKSEIIKEAKALSIALNPNAGQMSDGYHTFDELYHYRMLYNAGMANALVELRNRAPRIGLPNIAKSWRHADGELCFGKDNYFVVVMNLPTGQISNHYHGKYWDLFKVPEAERAPEWDGHTPQEAADRLERYLRGDYA